MAEKMSREARKTQLFLMIGPEFDRIVHLYTMASGSAPVVGMLASQMIEAILDKEYPQAAQT